MFFYNTYKRRRLIRKIQEIFSSAFQSQIKMKIGKDYVPLIFPKYQLALIFECNEDVQKRKLELEKIGVKVFVIGNNEDIFKIINRLIYILYNLEKDYINRKSL